MRSCQILIGSFASKIFQLNFKNVLSIRSYRRDLPVNRLWLVVTVERLEMLLRFFK